MQDCDLKIMIVSRGSGWGHAVPDIVIMSRLLHLRPSLQIIPVSYADGAEAYRAHKLPVIDMHRVRTCGFFELMIAYAKLFSEQKPNLVIAHEEYPAVIAARLLGSPCLFLTDFFMDPTSMPMQALKYATEVIYLGKPGLFTEPPFLRNKLYYAGYVVRNSSKENSNRPQIREEYGTSQHAIVVLCQPGSWFESQNPIAELLAHAWQHIPEPRHLFIVAGSDFELFRHYFKDQSSVTLLRRTDCMQDYISTCDVVITKGSRQTVYEACSMGVPSISLSAGLNWPDDIVMSRLRSNVPFDSAEVTPNDLAKAIIRQAKLKKKTRRIEPRGAIVAAERIELYCDALLSPLEPSKALTSADQ